MRVIHSVRLALPGLLLCGVLHLSALPVAAQFGFGGGFGGPGIGVGPGGLIPNSPGNPAYIDPFFRSRPTGNSLSASNFWYGDDGWDGWGRDYSSEVDQAVRDLRLEKQPPLPTGEELKAMNYKKLRRVLRVGAAHLEHELSKIRGGEHWVKFLAVEALQERVQKDNPSPPVEEARVQLAALLKSYDQTAANPAYNIISQLFGFRAVHSGLKEILEPAMVHLQSQLTAANRALTAQLQQTNGGAAWLKFLALPPSLATASDGPVAPGVAEEFATPAEVNQLISRFKQTAADEQYNMISDQPGFAQTQQTLEQISLQMSEPDKEAEKAPAPKKSPEKNTKKKPAEKSQTK